MKLYRLIIFTLVAVISLGSFSWGAQSFLVKIKSKKALKEKSLAVFNLQKALPANLFKKNGGDRLQSSLADSLLVELDSYYIVASDELKNLPAEIAQTAVPNYIFRLEKIEKTPNDPLLKDQWYTRALKAEQAWRIATGKGVTVAVVDAGIDFNAPDLVNSLKVNQKEDINGNGRFDPWSSTEARSGVTGDLNGKDDDGNGFVDDVIGYDFVNQAVISYGDWSDPDPIPEDERGHGTPVSGVIAAQANNSIGISGLAPDSKLLICKAFDIEGAAESDDIAAALIYGVRSGARIINCSFGEDNDSPILRDAVRYAYARGCVVVASAGNNGWERAHYPSDYSEVISVSGTNEKGGRWALSNYGSMPDISAPADNILTITSDSSYERYQGTSFAAPCVSAAAALLLEAHPELTPDEVRSWLMFSSEDAGKKGWDSLFGSGSLDMYAALAHPPATLVTLGAPGSYQAIDRDKVSSIDVEGSTISTLFDSFQLLVGYGLLPDTLRSVSPLVRTQIKNGALANLPLSDFPLDTVYTLVLKVNQKNGRDLQQRAHLWITSSSTKLEFTSFNTFPAYTNDKRVLLVGAASNRDSKFSVKWRAKGSDGDYSTLSDIENMSKVHYLSISDSIIYGVLYEAVATISESDSSSATRTFEFILKDDYLPVRGFVQKQYTLPMAYFAPIVGDFYGDNKPDVAFSDLGSFDYGPVKIYQFDQDQFKLRDSLNELWIPMDFGETNGDGKLEFLGVFGGRTTLRQSATPGGSIFSQKLLSRYEDARNFWSCSLEDLDGDNKDELIAMTDSALVVYGFSNGDYNLIASGTLPPRFKKSSLSRIAVVGDFDGDGKKEICHSNEKGNLFIFKFDAGRLRIDYIDSVDISEKSQYLKTADVDGDGIPEILQGNVASKPLVGSEGNGGDIWNYRLIKYTEKDRYSIIWQEHFTGVRYLGVAGRPLGYRNGSASGDVDGRPGDEVIISAFPNLYVFTWDKGVAKPLWTYPAALANTAVIYDFDKNGTNEIGFSGFDRSVFFEKENIQSPAAPLNLRGRQIAANQARLTWLASPEAKSYNVYRIDRSGAQPIAVKLGSTDTTYFIYTEPSAPKTIEFLATAVNETMLTPESDYSNIATVNLRGLAVLVSARALDSMIVEATYSQSLPNAALEPSNFLIVSDTSTTYSIISEISTAAPVSPSVVYLRLKKPLAAHSDNFLRAGAFEDLVGNLTVQGVVKIDYVPAEPHAEEMILTELKQLSPSLFQLTFSHKLNASTVANLSNFKLEPIGEIIGAEVDFVDSSKVLITISNFLRNKGARGMYYEIVAGPGLRSEEGVPMTTGPGNRLGFVIAAEDLKGVYLFPNPISLSENYVATIGGLTRRAEVEILTVDGKLLRSLIENDANGGVDWDLKDKDGKPLEPGVYLIRAKNTEEQYPDWEYSKFVIKR